MIADRAAANLRRRYRRERVFRAAGLLAVLTGLSFLAYFLTTLVAAGYSAFRQTTIELEIEFPAEEFAGVALVGESSFDDVNYLGLVRDALRRAFPEVTARNDLRDLFAIVSSSASLDVRDFVRANPGIIGSRAWIRVLADDEIDMLVKGAVDRAGPEIERRVTDRQLAWLEQLERDGRVRLGFNERFFTQGDSRDPEMAGIRGATVGSFFMLLVTLSLSLPLGVATAVYLEEFASQNRWTDLIEVNINNLAAVPSVIFGLLGLALFINWFGLPRSAPLVGGLVLTLMTLPVVIISSRAALKSVPPSIREAAMGIGASKMQMVVHHVVPLALPGMLTGTIIGMARALGESAPLLMIGMVAFIVDVPSSPLDPATALPVQVYLWADSPERAFVERTAAAILVLLGFLLLMNATAVLLRRRFERRW